MTSSSYQQYPDSYDNTHRVWVRSGYRHFDTFDIRVTPYHEATLGNLAVQTIARARLAELHWFAGYEITAILSLPAVSLVKSVKHTHRRGLDLSDVHTLTAAESALLHKGNHYTLQRLIQANRV